MIEPQDLRPCPFCGCTLEVSAFHSGGVMYVHPYALCPMSGHVIDHKRSAELWNERSHAEAAGDQGINLQDMLDEIRDIIEHARPLMSALRDLASRLEKYLVET